MLDGAKGRLTYANVTATIALVVALGGTSYAALRVGSPQIVNNSVRSVDLRDNAIRGRDVRYRSLTGRDIEYGGLGGAEIAEGELGTVPNANRFQGRVLDQLIVGCREPARATGTVCIEATPRPATNFTSANYQCATLGGRLPLYVELRSSTFYLPTPEWTADILEESGGVLATLVFGDSGVGSSALGVSRPYRCALPLSNR